MNREVSDYLKELEARNSSLSLRQSSRYALDLLMVYLHERYGLTDWRRHGRSSVGFPASSATRAPHAAR